MRTHLCVFVSSRRLKTRDVGGDGWRGWESKSRSGTRPGLCGLEGPPPGQTLQHTHLSTGWRDWENRGRERANEGEKKSQAAFVDGTHKRTRHELNKRLAFNRRLGGCCWWFEPLGSTGLCLVKVAEGVQWVESTDFSCSYLSFLHWNSFSGLWMTFQHVLYCCRQSSKDKISQSLNDVPKHFPTDFQILTHNFNFKRNAVSLPTSILFKEVRLKERKALWHGCVLSSGSLWHMPWKRVRTHLCGSVGGERAIKERIPLEHSPTCTLKC